MIEELKTFFYSLFSWTAAFLAPLVINFNDFLIFFLLLLRCFSCILHVYLVALCALNDITLHQKKKKNDDS
jgi:hypothetical protein